MHAVVLYNVLFFQTSHKITPGKEQVEFLNNDCMETNGCQRNPLSALILCLDEIFMFLTGDE